MKNTEKLRIRRIKIQQKVAKTIRKAKEYAASIADTGPELNLAIVRFLTPRQLKQVVLLPKNFERAFGEDFPRLAESELIDRQLTLNEEEK